MFEFEVFERDSVSWTQAVNPLARTDADMQPENVVLEAGRQASEFKGLSLSSNEDFILSGTGDLPWFYVIGFQSMFGRAPAYIDNPRKMFNEIFNHQNNSIIQYTR